MRFLIFIFIALSCYNSDIDAKEAGTEASSYSTFLVVQDSNGLDSGDTCTTALDIGNFAAAPFKRSSLFRPCESGFAHQDGKCTTSLAGRKRDESGMEVLAMQENEQKIGSILSKLRHFLGRLHRGLGLADTTATLPQTAELKCAQKINQQERTRKGKIQRRGRKERSGATQGYNLTIHCTALFAIWYNNALAQDGLWTLSVASGLHCSGITCASTTGCSAQWNNGPDPSLKEGIPGHQQHASRCSRSLRSHGYQRYASNHEGLARCYDCPGESETYPPRSSRIQTSAQGGMASASRGKRECLGVSAGELPQKYGTTSGSGSSCVTGSILCAESHPVVELARGQGSPSHRRATTGRVAGCHCIGFSNGCRRRGIEEERSPNNEAMSGCIRWGAQRRARDFGRRKQRFFEPSKATTFGGPWSFEDNDTLCYVVIHGRIHTCLRKGGCRRPLKVSFRDVEAYSPQQLWASAASIRKLQGMKTEEMLIYRHSVVTEFDYIDPFMAGLRAMTMRWDVISGSHGLCDYDGFQITSNKAGVDDHNYPGGVDWQEQIQPPLTVRYEERQQCRLLPDTRHLLPESSTALHEDNPEEDDVHEGQTDFYPNQEWVTFFEEVTANDDSEQLFTVYGLAEVEQGVRYVALQDPTPGLLVRAIRNQFPEFLEWHLRVHRVHPQPMDMAA